MPDSKCNALNPYPYPDIESPPRFVNLYDDYIDMCKAKLYHGDIHPDNAVCPFWIAENIRGWVAERGDPDSELYTLVRKLMDEGLITRVSRGLYKWDTKAILIFRKGADARKRRQSSRPS